MTDLFIIFTPAIVIVGGSWLIDRFISLYTHFDSEQHKDADEQSKRVESSDRNEKQLFKTHD